ncbi:MAG: hypothetical protein KatS3mg023_3603 [Armatimonadota bacterium]|nr:MAG: hypothetical protein KatS3mg023_3603 [Armatimonadota bacterium]
MADVESMLIDFMERNVILVAKVQWFMPHDGELKPMLHEGNIIIKRVPLRMSDLFEVHENEMISSNMMLMHRRYGYPNISLHPAVARVTLDYILVPQGDTKQRIDVQDGGIDVSAQHLASGDPDTLWDAHTHLLNTMLSVFIKDHQRISRMQFHRIIERIAKTTGKTRRVAPPTHGFERYRGNGSEWLQSEFDDRLGVLRITDGDGLWSHIRSLVSYLMHLLNRTKRPAKLSIHSALRPMLFKQSDGGYVLDELGMLNKSTEPIDDALFAWTTETLPAQVFGYVSLAPQTRFVWCTREFVVCMDYRIWRMDSVLGTLLPSVYLVALDLKRQLAYILFLNQLPGGKCDGSYRLAEFIPADSMNALTLTMCLLALSNSVPELFDPSLLDDIGIRELELRLPSWMDSKLVFTCNMRALSDLHGRVLDFNLLPDGFDKYIQDILLMFTQTGYKRCSVAVRLGTQSMPLKVKHPAQMGLAAGVNRIEGTSSISLIWPYQRWMKRSFAQMDTLPWHVLAWRFFDCAARCGLRDRFARYLWRVDRSAAELLFGLRTLAGMGEPIVPIWDAASLKGDRDNWSYDARHVVSGNEFRRMGRRFVVTIEEYRSQIMEFDVERFLTLWPSSRSMLELVMSED